MTLILLSGYRSMSGLQEHRMEHRNEAVDVFRDFGSETTVKRLGLQSLFDKVDKKYFEGLLARAWGRLVRGMDPVLLLARVSRKAGIKVIASHEAEDEYGVTCA